MIAAFCSEVGTVTEVSPPKDRDTGRPKGFVFAWLELHEGLPWTSWEKLNGQFIGDRAITVQLESRYARRREQQQRKRTAR